MSVRVSIAIDDAISKRREERFQTADEFLLALKRVGSLTAPLKPESAVAAVASSATTVRRETTTGATLRSLVISKSA
jgi:hypothetical protein